MACNKADAILSIGKNGRTGNKLAQVTKAVFFAAATNMTCVHLEPKSYNNSLLAMPEYLRLGKHSIKGDGCTSASSESWLHRCGASSVVCGNFWLNGCHGVAAGDLRPLAEAYIKPYARFSTAEGFPRGDNLLTAHLRGGDLLKESRNGYANHWMWAQPPCAVYERIVNHGNYSAILVVLDKPVEAHPCVPWFRNFSKHRGLKLRIQSSSVVEDARAIYRARNLALSYSTFGESIALVSGEAKRLYVYNTFQEHSAMNCKLWPGVSLYGILGPNKPPARNNTLAALWAHMTTYKDVAGPVFVTDDLCKRGSEGEWALVFGNS